MGGRTSILSVKDSALNDIGVFRGEADGGNFGNMVRPSGWILRETADRLGIGGKIRMF